MDTRVSSFAAVELRNLGALSCSGDQARDFLHAQLTSDVASLGAREARRAGWCSAKGRLLATFFVLPADGGFLLQVSRDIAPAVAKRLSMFILRTKAKLSDVSDTWTQYGVWGSGAAQRLADLGLPLPQGVLDVASSSGVVVVRTAAQPFIVFSREPLAALPSGADEAAWALEEIRAGYPRVTSATQDLFVPQMVNLERLGAVDFKKGCYPGQEIVARTQYRGVLKRRMVRARVEARAEPGQDLHVADLAGQAAGTVVNAAPTLQGSSELLAVVQISSLEGAHPIRLGAPDGPALELLPLPYA